MQEITMKKEYDPPEIRVIDPTRTSLAPVRMDPRPIRKKRNFAQSAILFLACVGAGFFAGLCRCRILRRCSDGWGCPALLPAGGTDLRKGVKLMRRRYEEPDKRELAERRIREREQSAEDYIDYLYATGRISPDEYARLLEM